MERLVNELKIYHFIGGFLIDSIDGNYLDIYNELYNNTDELVNKFYTNLSVEDNSSIQNPYSFTILVL